MKAEPLSAALHARAVFGDNLRVNSRGHRVCRTCDRAIQRRYYERKAV